MPTAALGGVVTIVNGGESTLPRAPRAASSARRKRLDPIASAGGRASPRPHATPPPLRDQAYHRVPGQVRRPQAECVPRRVHADPGLARDLLRPLDQDGETL